MLSFFLGGKPENTQLGKVKKLREFFLKGMKRWSLQIEKYI